MTEGYVLWCNISHSGFCSTMKEKQKNNQSTNFKSNLDEK